MLWCGLSPCSSFSLLGLGGWSSHAGRERRALLGRLSCGGEGPQAHSPLVGGTCAHPELQDWQALVALERLHGTTGWSWGTKARRPLGAGTGGVVPGPPVVSCNSARPCLKAGISKRLGI